MIQRLFAWWNIACTVTCGFWGCAALLVGVDQFGTVPGWAALASGVSVAYVTLRLVASDFERVWSYSRMKKDGSENGN